MKVMRGWQDERHYMNTPPANIDPIAMYYTTLRLRRYIALLTLLLTVMIGGWFMDKYIIDPPLAAKQAERVRVERLVWQCEMEKRFDMTTKASCDALQEVTSDGQ